MRCYDATANSVTLYNRNFKGYSLWLFEGSLGSVQVPPAPTWKKLDCTNSLPKTKVDTSMIHHLERLALVDFGNKEGIDRLEAAIAFADQLESVDTTGIEPLYTVLEDRTLLLRKDEVTEGNCRSDILKPAKLTEEDYYVAPPGNIPLKKNEKEYVTYSDKQTKSSS